MLKHPFHFLRYGEIRSSLRMALVVKPALHV